MISKDNVKILNVKLYNEVIGLLTLLPTEQILFTFNENYINNSNRPVLSLSFKDQFGGIILSIKPYYLQIPPFFSNLLPEGALREYLAHQAGVNAKREFYLLWALGADLPGAITVEPVNHERWPNESKIDSISNDFKNVLRFSLAGVQLKLSAIEEARGGLTIPAKGIGGFWILKLPSMHFENVPENEFSMMKLASKMGMDIPNVKLVPLEKIHNMPENMSSMKGNALAVERFDRTHNGESIHIEDFAQIFGLYPKDKYQKVSYKNIAQVIWKEVGEEGIVEYIRRLIFNTLIGNADMHLKNWSFIYRNKRNAQLSPGYDFVSTIHYIQDDSMALNFVKTKRMDSVSIESLQYFARKAELPSHIVETTAKDTVLRFIEVWNKEKHQLALTNKMIAVIEQNLQRIPLVREV